MFHNHQYIKQAESRVRDDAEVKGDDGRSVILHKGRPAARKRLPYAQQVKPFNFALAAHVLPYGLPPDADPERFQLIKPYGTNPKKWATGWIDGHSGNEYAITTNLSTQRNVVRVKSYADVLVEYEAHPELKSVGAEGVNPRKAIGLLARRHIRIVPERICYHGKESNRLEEVETELEHRLDDVLEVYREPGGNGLAPQILEALKKIPSRELARIAGISERAIRAIRNGHFRPSPKTRAALIQVCQTKKEVL